jgi:hypothetical protein
MVWFRLPKPHFREGAWLERKYAESVALRGYPDPGQPQVRPGLDARDQSAGAQCAVVIAIRHAALIGPSTAESTPSSREMESSAPVCFMMSAMFIVVPFCKIARTQPDEDNQR